MKYCILILCYTSVFVTQTNFSVSSCHYILYHLESQQYRTQAQIILALQGHNFVIILLASALL